MLKRLQASCEASGHHVEMSYPEEINLPGFVPKEMWHNFALCFGLQEPPSPLQQAYNRC